MSVGLKDAMIGANRRRCAVGSASQASATCHKKPCGSAACQQSTWRIWPWGVWRSNRHSGKCVTTVALRARSVQPVPHHLVGVRVEVELAVVILV